MNREPILIHDNKILSLDTQIEERMLIAWKGSAENYLGSEHAHRYYELIFNFSEIPMRHTVADHGYTTDSMFILYRAPYILHSSTTCGVGPYTRYSVIFHHNVLTEFGGICKLGKLGRHLECLIPVTPGQMQTLEPLLHRLCRSRDPSVPKHMWIGSLAALLFEVNELTENAVPHSIESPPYMQKLLRYISEHLDEPLTLDSLAEKFFVSRAKLTKDFRAAVKTSLHEYVTAVRLHRAKILLREGVPIPIVSQQCGYALESSFIYMFHTRTGMTPGEYRKSSTER